MLVVSSCTENLHSTLNTRNSTLPEVAGTLHANQVRSPSLRIRLLVFCTAQQAQSAVVLYNEDASNGRTLQGLEGGLQPHLLDVRHRGSCSASTTR